jgi:plasmid maintenance system killer protein
MGFTGAVGEGLAVEYMRNYMQAPDTQPLVRTKHLPLDLISREYAVEVKGGLVSNIRQAQQWRLTFSQFVGEEAERYARMSASERAMHTATKRFNIMQRKKKFLSHLNEAFKRELTPLTITTIIDCDRREADLFVFEGWHSRIGWNAPDTEDARRGTFRFDLMPPLA